MIGFRIIERRSQLGYTQKELAKKVNINVSVLNRIEKEERSVRDDELVALAKTLETTTDYLTGFSDNPYMEKKNYKRIKVYGRVPAGIPLEAIEDVEDFEDISFNDSKYTPHKEYIGLKVKGDSMYPKYLEGDTVIIEITPQVESGTDAVVYINGYEATLKKVTYTNSSITLTPLNPQYPPKTYGKNDDPVIILGKVIEIRRNV